MNRSQLDCGLPLLCAMHMEVTFRNKEIAP
jgi:hypothetical protein